MHNAYNSEVYLYQWKLYVFPPGCSHCWFRCSLVVSFFNESLVVSEWVYRLYIHDTQKPGTGLSKTENQIVMSCMTVDIGR
jgi:hypothetical protein